MTRDAGQRHRRTKPRQIRAAARRWNASRMSARRSWRTASRRKRANHASVRSTTHTCAGLGARCFRSRGARCAGRCRAGGRRGGSGGNRTLYPRAAWPGACAAAPRTGGPAARRRAPAPASGCRARSRRSAGARAGRRSRPRGRGAWSGLAAVGRVRAGELAPLFAGKEALSSEQRDQSIAFARPRRSSSARCSRSKTPAACQSLSRRQQVMPEPRPMALGSLAHGMPVRSTKTMPSSALRSSSGGRPPLKRGARSGSWGAISAQSASDTKGSAIRRG